VFTYGDLAAMGARVAAGLLEVSGGADDLREARVAFLVPPSFAHVAVQRGIWLAGGVAVPLAVSHPPAELEYVVRDSGASIVIASGRHADALEKIAQRAEAHFLRTPDLLAGEAEKGDSPLFESAVQTGKGDSLLFESAAQTRKGDSPLFESAAQTGKGDSPLLEFAAQTGKGDSPLFLARRALIVYTSGTTGKPKGVVTTHAQHQAQIDALLTAWEWTPDDNALLVLPLHHVHGIVNVLGSALAAGAHCEILPQFEPEAAWSRLASGEITVFSAVPTIYYRLIAAWDAAPPATRRVWSDGSRRARLMMSGSAALPVRTLERWRAITGHTLLERYGMTETGMILSNPLHGERRPGAVGVPLPGVDVRLIDGEIEVRGPGVFTEYWGREAETRDAFHDGWFRTGDAASFEDGAYRLLGRTSTDIIKTGGYKVSALEIEDAVREHPAVADCAVVGAADDEWGERVRAFVELRPGGSLTLDTLRDGLRARLAPYKLPSDLRLMEALPRNAMGKVNKRLLPG
jgi:malonyl-CoA/methylmalonyl-CoA synthetase